MRVNPEFLIFLFSIIIVIPSPEYSGSRSLVKLSLLNIKTGRFALFYIFQNAVHWLQN